MPQIKYKIKFTNIANDDLGQIYNYSCEELAAEIAANNLLLKIESSIVRLSIFPESGSLVTDEILRNKGYHRLTVDNYLVFYLVDEENKQVVIVRILYGGRQYENIL